MGQLTPKRFQNDSFPPDVLKLLSAFATRNVRYLIIGGYAVGAYGYLRGTRDLDVWLSPIGDNLEQVGAALEAEGADRQAIEAFIDEVSRNQSGSLSVGDEVFQIDFLLKPKGGDFEPFYDRKHTITIAGEPISIIGYEDLILLKKAAKRPIDFIDIQNLEAGRRK